MKNKLKYAIFAASAAVFYALNIPLSKLLLRGVGSTQLAGILYLGAGFGIGMLFLVKRDKGGNETLLNKKDLPYIAAMVLLDIIAPILLMYGLKRTAAGNVSLLNNFEIVATSIIALVIFKEAISPKLGIAIALITVSGALLSFEDISAFTFSKGSVAVLLAAVCWGFENNCTRKISGKNPYEIVAVKGIFSGIGSLAAGFIAKESITVWWYVFPALLLGFVAYGLSILFYIKAQYGLGAAKTSAFYAVNPFIATAISVILFNERFTWHFLAAFLIMIAGTAILISDILFPKKYRHTHNLTHTHDGSTHPHIITHSHSLTGLESPSHIHSEKELLGK